jgi:hypothetical protein
MESRLIQNKVKSVFMETPPIVCGGRAALEAAALQVLGFRFRKEVEKWHNVSLRSFSV